MMRDAPASAAPFTADRPTPPQPMTATVEPAGTRAVLITAPTPVMTPQPTSVARSSGMSRSIFTSAFSCTTICSAKAERLRNWCISSPPFQDSRRDWPGTIFTSVFSHSTVRPEVHCWQAPQNTDRQPITWSPGTR